MTKKELVEAIFNKCSGVTYPETIIPDAVDLLLENMIDHLGEGGRVEIRGFGSFSLHKWGPRHARNPQTGESWRTESVYTTHFKPGKQVRERVNNSKPKQESTD